jgi:hypothetical protein
LRQGDTVAALRKTSLPDPGAQLRHPLVAIPLPATTDLPAPQQVHRSGCAMHPRGNAHHVGQPDQVSRVMGKELPDPFNCRCHHRFPNEANDRTFPSPTLSESKCRIINGILRERSKSPSLPLMRLMARERIVPEIGHARLMPIGNVSGDW